MKASSRTARNIIKARRAEAKAHRAGLHTLKSHALRAGLDENLADGVSGALRSKAKGMGCASFMVRKTAAGVRPVRNGKRYTKDEFLAAAAAYAPRLPKYRAARELLLSY